MADFKATEHPHHLQIEFFARESANALSLGGARELATLVRRHKAWRKPVVVTSAHPSLFCSGGNLRDHKRIKVKAAGLKANREIERALNLFAAWPTVKLALIEGDALGGGMEWLARFDLRWSTPSALFAFWQRRIGLTSGWGGGRAWAAWLGEATVRRLLLEGRLLGAHDALGLGIVDRVVSSWKIREAAAEWAADLDSPAVGTLTKWRVAQESAIFARNWMGHEHKRFLAKWKG